MTQHGSSAPRSTPPSYELYEGQEQRESRLLFSLLGMVSDLVLDLDFTADRARELLTLAMFERAQKRYQSNTRVSLAFDSALRTVKKIKSRLVRKGLAVENSRSYNLRRKVYLLLLDRPRTLDEIAQELPVNFEVNYARLSVETLKDQGLVDQVIDKPGTYRAVLPRDHHDLGLGEDESEALDGLQRYLKGVARVAQTRLLSSTPDSGLARGFVAQVQRDAIPKINAQIRDAVVAILVEAERDATETTEPTTDYEVLVGATPSREGSR